MEVTRRGFIQGVGALCALTVVKPDELAKLLEEHGLADVEVPIGSELWFPIELYASDVENICISINGVPLVEGTHFTCGRDTSKGMTVSITHFPPALDDDKSLSYRIDVTVGEEGRGSLFGFERSQGFSEGPLNYVCGKPKKRRHRFDNVRARKGRKAIRRRGVC